MSKEVISPEVECLKLKQAINENHRLAQKLSVDAIERALLAGEQIAKWKELLPHGKFEPFVEKHFDGSLRTAQRYMKATKALSSLSKSARVSLLESEDSINSLLSRLKKDDSEDVRGSARDRRIPAGESASSFMGERDTVAYGSSVQLGGAATAAPGEASSDSISDKGKPGGAATSSDNSPASTGPASEEAADSNGDSSFQMGNMPDDSGEDAEPTGTETTDEPQEKDPRPPRSGKEQNYGKCPNCAGVKWDVETDGVSCSKCHHPHGEPVGDRAADEDPAETLREKTRKTGEAFMRCFDDLQLLVPKAGAHKQCIELCKNLLKSAKGWK